MRIRYENAGKLTREPTALRRSAGQPLAAKPEVVSGTLIDEKKLQHELLVHQIELEMLNQNQRDTPRYFS